MKLVNRLSTVAVLVFFSIGAAGVLILLHGCADLRLLFSPSAWTHGPHSIIPLLALGALLFGAIVLFCWMIYFTCNVVKVLRRAEDFISGILAGELPQPLQTDNIREDEIISLFSTLNFMRDRQLNLAERLKCRIESEEQLRKDVEYSDDLILAALSRLVPEMRRSAGIVKAYTLIELARARKCETGDIPLEERTMLASLKRQSRLSRELDFISDIAKLERKTWNSPVIAPFSSTSLIQELTDRCSVSLQARNIKFCCEYQSGLPESLNGCRELLYQLLHLLVRFVSRSLAGNSQVTFAASGRKGDAVFEIRDRNCDEHRELLAANYLKASERGDIPDPEKCSLSVIGLEIVRNIAEKTGCSLEVDSGNGSLTILRLIVPGSAADHTNGALAGIVRHETRFTPAPADEDEQLTVLMSAEDHEEAAAVAMLLAHSNIKIVSFPDNSTLLQNVEKTPDVSGIIIAAPFTQDSPPQSYIPQIRRLAGVSVLPVLVITPVYSKELALELAAIPQVTGLVQPLNYAQVVHLLRGTPPGKG